MLETTTTLACCAPGFPLFLQRFPPGQAHTSHSKTNKRPLFYTALPPLYNKAYCTTPLHCTASRPLSNCTAPCGQGVEVLALRVMTEGMADDVGLVARYVYNLKENRMQTRYCLVGLSLLAPSQWAMSCGICGHTAGGFGTQLSGGVQPSQNRCAANRENFYQQKIRFCLFHQPLALTFLPEVSTLSAHPSPQSTLFAWLCCK